MNFCSLSSRAAINTADAVGCGDERTRDINLANYGVGIGGDGVHQIVEMQYTLT
jgi:hypothetical protein